MLIVLRTRRNEKELKVKPATSFKYFQYLLTKNSNKVKVRENIIKQYISPSEYFSKQIPPKVSDPTI